MKSFDRFLQKWRIKQASNFIRQKDKVLDIGTFDGSLFTLLAAKGITGVGIEPLQTKEIQYTNFKILPGYFPSTSPNDNDFDVITVLAVFEHVPVNEQISFLTTCREKLKENGLLIITVPSVWVDYLLCILKFIRVIDGMSLEEHYGFNPETIIKIAMEANFELYRKKKFQLGLNNLFVFKKH